jgi:hypothetical protein
MQHRPLKPIKHIVSVSSGVPSGLVAILAVERFGAENVELVFADTQVEHEDNYRFLKDIETYIGKKISGLKEGRTPLQVASDEHIVPNQKLANCTKKLKIFPIRKFVNQFRYKFRVVMHIGFDTSAGDKQRVAANREGWASVGIESRYLLIEDDIRDAKFETEKRGLKIPYTYSLKFKHGNCLGEDETGGRGCVKFGRGDMIKILQEWPESYKKREAWELTAMQKHYARWFPYFVYAALYYEMSFEELGFKIYTFLRDFTGEYDGVLTLRKLREEYENKQGNTRQMRLFDLSNDMAGCSTECSIHDFSEWKEKAAA